MNGICSMEKGSAICHFFPNIDVIVVFDGRQKKNRTEKDNISSGYEWERSGNIDVIVDGKFKIAFTGKAVPTSV